MNNRHRRVARLKEQERQQRFKKVQTTLEDFNQAMNWIESAWKTIETTVAKVFSKEDDNWKK